MDDRDWSGLPGDVIRLIFRKLPDPLDFVRSRAVCKTWYSAGSLSDLPTYLPWLLECPSCRFGGTILRDHLRYYSLSSKRTGVIGIKKSTNIMHRTFGGPSRGYVLIWEFGQLSLVNPLSKETISLPSLKTSMPWPIWPGADSNNQIRDQNIVVLDRCLDYWNLDQCLDDWKVTSRWAFYNKESGKWITQYGVFNSCCYFQGKLFCIDNRLSYTRVYDVSTGKQIYNIASPNGGGCWKYCYLVESAGELLGVRVSLVSEYENVENVVTFRIYKLDFGEKDGQPHWVRITSIGDQVLFLDSMNGFSMSSAHCPELRGNFIYFLYSKAFGKHGRRPYKYDIELGTVEKLECPFKCSTWFVPCLR